MGERNTAKRAFLPGKGTLVALLAVAMLSCMGGAAVAPALPAISQAFPEASETMVSLVISLPSLAVAISGAFLGVVADRVGKMLTLAVSLAVFTASGLACIFLQSLESILVMRFIMGVGMAGAATASTALIADYYDPAMQARVLGLQSAAAGASILILETGGGFLALFGWRVPFLVYLVGAVMLLLVLMFVREATGAKVGLDGKPVAVLGAPGADAGAAAAGGGAGSSGPAAGSAGAATGANAGAATSESSPEPMRRVLRPRTALAVLAMCLGFVLATQMCTFLVPSKSPYLVAELGGSTAISGLVLGTFGLSNMLSSLAYARMVRKLGRFLLLGVSYLFAAAGIACFALADHIWMLFAGAALVNVGIGWVMPLVVNWIASVSTRENSGRHMGLFTVFLNLGQFVCSLWAGAVVAHAGNEHVAFAFAAVLLLLLSAVAFFGRLRFASLQKV